MIKVAVWQLVELIKFCTDCVEKYLGITRIINKGLGRNTTLSANWDILKHFFFYQNDSKLQLTALTESPISKEPPRQMAPLLTWPLSLRLRKNFGKCDNCQIIASNIQQGGWGWPKEELRRLNGKTIRRWTMQWRQTNCNEFFNSPSTHSATHQGLWISSTVWLWWMMHTRCCHSSQKSEIETRFCGQSWTLPRRPTLTQQDFSNHYRNEFAASLPWSLTKN